MTKKSFRLPILLLSLFFLAALFSLAAAQTKTDEHSQHVAAGAQASPPDQPGDAAPSPMMMGMMQMIKFHGLPKEKGDAIQKIVKEYEDKF
ncbi:MAG: hypothetical protein HQK55_06595, partial [Deltaproteobacteria bacterium]|nr:hypothetical protein [Deltaproteobacteria bacterium]